MMGRILILGAGFAGMWSALSAARAADLTGKHLEIIVLAPEAKLGIRPRYYENDLTGLAIPLGDLFKVTGIHFIAGQADEIDSSQQVVFYLDVTGTRRQIDYDRLVVATGSNLRRPNVTGFKKYAFDNDQLSHAIHLQSHLERLADQPNTPKRNTVVVVGGGFTGIETAAELPTRLRSILGPDVPINVVIVEQAAAIGPDLGLGPRSIIEQALQELGVAIRLGVAVVAVDIDGVSLENGDHILSSTVIWTTGLEANILTGQIAGERDQLGRLHVASDLRVIGQDHIYAAGDTAFAATDDRGHNTLMSCQHAMNLGRAAGHNAAADLLVIPHVLYCQPNYVTCLDLGAWGAVYTEGWDRIVKLSGAGAKALKHRINTEWIYPPKADRAAAFAAADPLRIVVA